MTDDEVLKRAGEIALGHLTKLEQEKATLVAEIAELDKRMDVWHAVISLGNHRQRPARKTRDDGADTPPRRNGAPPKPIDPKMIELVANHKDGGIRNQEIVRQCSHLTERSVMNHLQRGKERGYFTYKDRSYFPTEKTMEESSQRSPAAADDQAAKPPSLSVVP